MKVDKVTQDYIDSHPHDCSNVLMRPWQYAFYACAILSVIAMIFYHWLYLLVIVNSCFALAYFCVIVFRVVSVKLSLLGYGEIRVPEERIGDLSDEDLPIYTILVPLYKEANVAGKIVKHIGALDYPQEKLDVKLLLEEDDVSTVSTVKALDLPPCYHVMVVPDSQPKTKPKACNHGLLEAKGEFCVIFDAEDRPEPDQLKKVVAAFRDLQSDHEADALKKGTATEEIGKHKVACIQGKLNYYNAKQNLLTRWFAVEYGTTFDLYLPGLQVMGVPIPLGGTSNHFRTEVLQELGGWDPFNVTEDCDLGVRIYKRGYKTRVIDSTTWEEANPQLWNWIRQRSRWAKGFFQTHLTHMRNPARTLWSLGPWGFFGFIMSVGGSSIMTILNVFYWAIAAIYLGLLGHAASKGVDLVDMIFQHGSDEIVKPVAFTIKGYSIHAWPLLYHGAGQDEFWSTLSIIFFSITCVLIAANLLFVLMHVAACLKRGRWWLLPFAITMPFYWLLISIGAWKGFIQLFTNPFYWEKTIHGLDHEDDGEVLEEPLENHQG